MFSPDILYTTERRILKDKDKDEANAAKEEEKRNEKRLANQTEIYSRIYRRNCVRCVQMCVCVALFRWFSAFLAFLLSLSLHVLFRFFFHSVRFWSRHINYSWTKSELFWSLLYVYSSTYSFFLYFIFFYSSSSDVFFFFVFVFVLLRRVDRKRANAIGFMAVKIAKVKLLFPTCVTLPLPYVIQRVRETLVWRIEWNEFLIWQQAIVCSSCKEGEREKKEKKRFRLQKLCSVRFCLLHMDRMYVRVRMYMDGNRKTFIIPHCVLCDTRIYDVLYVGELNDDDNDNDPLAQSMLTSDFSILNVLSCVTHK